MPETQTASRMPTWARARDEGNFRRTRYGVAEYERRLKAVARQIDNLIRGYGAGNLGTIESALRTYAHTLEPWAESVAEQMLQEVGRRDARVWARISQRMGASLREQIASTPLGGLYRALMREQVGLITSLPLDAAQRVHELATGTLYSGARAPTLVDEIMRTGEVTRSRAMSIARTEVSRAATTLTQARAEYVGSDGYIWRTAADGDVRPSHRKMEGKFVRWSSPPTLDNLTGHAGALPNCRCFPEVVLPQEFRRVLH